MSLGKLIAFEGIDGCGKSTQLEMLCTVLEKCAVPVITTRQPTARYRENPVVRAYLEDGQRHVSMQELCRIAAADRRQHVQEIIEPALKRGTWVLCDRYVYSSYAFFQARGVELDFVRHENRNVVVPDVTFFLDIAATGARERVVTREGEITKFEERRLEFMETVRENFLQVQDATFVVIDAATTVEQMAAAILQEVNQRFGLSRWEAGRAHHVAGRDEDERVLSD